MSAGLTFDAAAHRYALDGEHIPGVSEILSAAGCLPSMEYVDPWYAQRGTYVHEACALFDQGRLDADTLDDALRPYVMAWVRFREEHDARLEILAIEEMAHCPVYRYAGTRDRRIRWDGALGVADLKCGPPAPWHALQMAGYLGLPPISGAGTVRLAVHLSKDGTYRLKQYDDRQDRHLFQSATALWWWRKTHGRLAA